MYAQIEALERQADEVVLLESRAELAESERDALLEVRSCPHVSAALAMFLCANHCDLCAR